jgi:hypothetical protein
VSSPRDEALAELRFHWSGAYNIQCLGDLWLAQRLDKSRGTVSARTADGLFDAIRADYKKDPIPRPPLPGTEGEEEP